MAQARSSSGSDSALADAPLLLRPWEETDVTGLRAAIDEDVSHVRPWLTWSLEEPATPERTRERLLEQIEQYHSDIAWRFAITPADQPAVILGGANLYPTFGPAARGLGYWVRRSAAGAGVAGSAVAALIVEAFADPEIGRMIIQCDVGNAASAAFARRLGFAYTGEAERTYPDGTPRPVLEFELTRAQYDAEHATSLRDRARRVRIADRRAFR